MNLFDTYVDEESKRLVSEVLNSGYLNQGKMVDTLESKLESELWFKNPLTINSCSNSLYLALLLAGVKEGDEVILPPQTFIATGLAILWHKAIPVFADVDSNGNLSPVDFYRKITPKTKAVIPVHWSGIPCEMDLIWEVAQNKGIKVIEDAAHALGAWYKSTPIGGCAYSDFCCFSLQAIKTLTAGDGGILCCRSDEDKERGVRLRWFGIDKKNVQRGPTGDRLMNPQEIGYKFHMNDVAAAIALGNLKTLKERVNKQRENASIYLNRLKDYPIVLPIIRDCDPAYWFFQLKISNRDYFVSQLREKGIPASTVDRRIDNLDLFKKYKTELSITNYYDNFQFAVPCHSQLTTNEVIKVIDTIKEILDEYQPNG